MKHCLIVVDYQQDFVTGALGFSAAEALELPICEKIRTCRAASYDILFTLDTHSDGYSTTAEGRHLPIPHCLKGTPGHAISGRVATEICPQDMLLEKTTFGSDMLFALLREKQYDTVQLVGVVSDICVLANAILAKTALPEAEISVDAACVASNDEKKNEEALDMLESQQIEVLNRKNG